VVLLASSCKKSEQAPAPAPAGSQGAAAPSAAAAPAARKPWYEGSWAGTYKSERHVMDVAVGAPRQWSKDDGSKAAGDGTLELSVAADGVVSGSAKGPLGTHSLRGRADEQGLNVELVPEPQEVEAFRGVLQTQRSGENLTGELRASSGDSLVVRKAAVTLSKKPSGG
jgi:hypothetical protein